MRFYILSIVLFCLFLSAVKASDLVEVLPLTNQILVLHFDDGYAVYHKKGQQRSNERVVVELLNTTEAVKPLNYIFTGTDDSNYSSGKNPQTIGRKTKGTEFTWMCQSWANGCVNTSPDHVEDHWIYLFLPQAMQSEKKIVRNWSGTVGNGLGLQEYLSDNRYHLART